MTQNLTQNVPIQRQQGGKVLSVGNGGTLSIETGGALSINGVDITKNPGAVTITPAAGTANVSLVTIQVNDRMGNALAKACVLDIILSDAATGAGLTATTASGAVAAGASGVDLVDWTTKKHKRVLTDATGKYILSITDTAKTGFYVAVVRGDTLTVSSQLVSGNYG